ncbi:MAG TPA: glycosyltransferase family 2 protein [Hyphomonadaceae bacterium]|jgi:succinoglycan biosynthesis protein ExoO
MSSKVDVSVIIPTWKAAGFIGRAVRSALASTGVNIEVVAVDDASPDDTFDVLKQLATTDPRVVIDRLPANAGPSAARNRAIALSNGRFIAILDADDTMTPDRLAYLVSVAQRNEADIVVDNMLEVDEAGDRISKYAFLSGENFEEPDDVDLETWIYFNQPMKSGDCLGYLKPLIRRSAIERLAARYDEKLRNSEDYYLIAHLLAAGARMSYVPEAGYLYRRSEDSTSHRLDPSQTRALLDAEERFHTLFSNTLTPQERSALARRERGLRDVDQFVRALDALKTRKIREVPRLLASDIRASTFTLATFAKIAMGKALGMKLV